MNDPSLTHFTPGGAAHMVDVGDKPATHRRAEARGCIVMAESTRQRLQAGEHHKGDVLGIARIAGIMAAKRTPDLIPLCHGIPLTAVELDFEPSGDTAVIATARVETVAATGVEMEALTAVHIALLTIYDMCKSVDRGMYMTDIRLEAKSGGRSGDWVRAGEAELDDPDDTGC